MLSVDEQMKIILKGAEEVIDREDLKEKLEEAIKNNKPLTIKLGLDPSAPDIHLGHAVVLRKIKQMQDLGHRAVIIIGDFTGMIGDPTGKSKARKQLTKEQVMINAKTYEEQIFKILHEDKTDLRFNSDWLEPLNFKDIIQLASKYTVARMLEREDFKNRFHSNMSISIHEFFYPLMQGYDSVVIKADIELGGTDQRFNVLMGRTLQRDYGQESQIALFMPLLEGTDGKEKMSKSLGNYIGICEDENTMFTKVMTIPDELIIKYYELATDIHPDEIDEIKNNLKDKKVNPRDIKLGLAKEIVKLYHGEEKAKKGEESFKRVFQKKEIPEDIAEVRVDYNDREDLAKIIVSAGFTGSKSEGRRLINQGAVRINNIKIDGKSAVKNGDILRVGKFKYAKIKLFKD